MKTHGKRSDKRRSSEQLKVKHSRARNTNGQLLGHPTAHINGYNLSIAMPLSIENVRYHNEEFRFPNAPIRSTIMCETPSTLRRCKSLPQSHTLTPTPYTAIASPRQIQPNQIPFISEDVSAHSVNSVSSYPSLLALKLSFTNHQSAHEPLSLISPELPDPTQLPLPKPPIKQNGETDIAMSSDSSFYDNEYDDEDDDDMDDEDILEDDDDDDVLHPHETRKQSNHSQCVPPTPRPSNNHKKKRHHSTHSIQSNVVDQSKLQTKPPQKPKTINIIPPQKRNPKTRFLSATTGSTNSLLDDEDKYDPPQASSIRVSVSTPSAEKKEKDKVHKLKVGKVPRNSQYPSYATALQSVIEEASEPASLEQHNIVLNNNKSKPMVSSNQSDASKEYHQYKQRQQAFNQIINKNKQQIKHNTSSMNMNVNININSDHSVRNSNSNNNNNNKNNNNANMNPNHKNKRRPKRKKAYYNKVNKSKSTSSTSLVITKNKKKRSNVDIRRPQTTRRIRVSSPMLNIKPKRQSNNNNHKNTMNAYKRDIRGVFRYELASEDTSDVVSDTTFTSASSVTSLSNDTTAHVTHSDARATKIANSMQRSSSISHISVSPVHTNTHYTNNKHHYPRRPVTIIRRAAPPNINKSMMNGMMRANSALYTPLKRHSHSLSPNQNHKKIGLFDGDSLITSQLTPRFRADANHSSGSGWEFLERDRFFLESKYRSCTGSEVSFDGNMEDKLSASTNYNHDVCKKEVHDAYERGFLAGYFLGVNIMQQQQKDKGHSAIAK